MMDKEAFMRLIALIGIFSGAYALFSDIRIYQAIGLTGVIANSILFFKWLD